jgi:hypothetical protein
MRRVLIVRTRLNNSQGKRTAPSSASFAKPSFTSMSDLTIFQILNEIEKKNYFLWEQLNESEQKQFHPLVLMKWMLYSGVSPIALQRVNHNLFALTKDQQFLKLATVGQKKSRKWEWVAKKPVIEEQLKAIQYVYDTNSRQAEQTLDLLTPAELEQVIQEYRDSTPKKETKKRR